MQLSSFTDYSIRVLIYLATIEPGALSTITTVSECYGISRHHLVKVVHKLGLLGYIDTVQGKHGGMRLARRPERINVGDVIRQMEPLTLLNCTPENCSITPACRLKSYLSEAKEAFLQQLDKYTIADLVADNPKLINLL